MQGNQENHPLDLLRCPKQKAHSARPKHPDQIIILPKLSKKRGQKEENLHICPIAIVDAGCKNRYYQIITHGPIIICQGDTIVNKP